MSWTVLRVAAVMVRGVLVAGMLGLVGWVGAAHVWVAVAGSPIVDGIAEVPVRSVIIVPGAQVYADGSPSWFLRARLDGAIALYRAGRAPKILVSGDHGREAYDETNAMRRYLVAHGVPDRDVFMDHAGFRTRDTMERARRVFGVRDAIICTQGLHAKRTGFLARDAGIDATILVVDGDQWMSFGSHLRERLATVLAAWDAAVGTEPRFLGPSIDLAGDGGQTRDGTP